MKNNLRKIILVLFAVIFTALGAYAFSFRNMTLDLVQISDTHISTDRDNTPYKALKFSSQLLRDAIEQINDIKGLDFVLFTGDMVDSATYDNYGEFYRLLTKLKYPSLNAFGNHDLLYGTIDKYEVLNLVKKYNPNYTFEDTFYAFTPKTDFRIVILDPNPQKDTGKSNGKLTDEQLNFLDKELYENQDKVVVIAMHYPPVEPFAAGEHSLLNANEFNEILLKYKNPIVVLAGHYHATKIRHIGNIVYVSTPSLVTYPMAFRHIKIVNFKDRVSYTFEFMPTRLDDIKEFNRKTVISYATLAGFEQDRNTSFVYYKNSPRSVRYKRAKIKNATKSVKTSKRELKKLSQPQKNKVDNPAQDVNIEDNTQTKEKSKKSFFKKNKKQKTTKRTGTNQ